MPDVAGAAASQMPADGARSLGEGVVSRQQREKDAKR